MRRLWLGLWCAVLAWDLLLPHVGAPSPGAAIALLVAAGALLLRRGGAPAGVAPDLALAAGLSGAIAAVLLPWPERLGPALLAVAGLLAVASTRRASRLAPPAAPLARAAAALGGWLLALAAVGQLYRMAEAAAHDLDALAPALAGLCRLFGLRVAADPPYVLWQGVGVLHSADCSLEKLVGAALALFTTAGVATLVALRGRRALRPAAALVAAAAVFAVLRFVALVLALDEGLGAAGFYGRIWTFSGLLVLVAFLAAVLPPVRRPAAVAGAAEEPSAAERRAGRAAAWRRAPGMLAPAAACGLLLAAALGFHDPGEPKHGRILVDEHHSNWEWSTIRFDTERYGVQTVYNYSELVRYLRHFWDVEPSFAPLADSLLATASVLVLKTPTRPYEPAEVDAIVRFVEAGGGLWLVGDHTNVFGMGTHLNQVARRFGLRFRYDAVIDLPSCGRQVYDRPRWFAHPVVRHLPPLLMATSCSLVGPLDVQRVVLGRSLLSDDLDYSVNTFFGNFRPDPQEPFGNMLQSAAVTRGRGRVLLWSDSTIFSNFFVFVRGKPELALGSIAWLMRANRWGWLRLMLAIAALLAAVVLLAAGWRRPRLHAAAALLVVGLPVFALAARGLDAWVASWSRHPAPRAPLPLVAFDRGRTAWELPDLAEQPERSARSFHTFYVWTQRVGAVPTTRLFERCLDGTRAVVLVNPRAPFEAAETAALADYVQRGGALLVLDTPHARRSSARDVLAPFGLACEPATAESVLVRDAATGDTLATLRHAGRVQGGEALLVCPDGRALAARVRHGRGQVLALNASDSFSDAVLGTTSEVPNPEQLALYRIEFRLVEELLRPPEDTARAP